MKTPDISVIIPNFNGSAYIREAIDSVIDQKNVDVEVIVVDDGSTDNSREILESFGKSINVFHQKNLGAPSARNLGWRKAQSKYIKFLDSDDRLVKNSLESELKIIDALDDNSIPFFDVEYIDEGGTVFDNHLKYRIPKNSESSLEYFLKVNPLTSCPLHRKNQIESVGGFTENLPKGQEWDLHLRLFLQGYRFKYFPKFSYQFREYDNEKRFSQVKLAKDDPLKYIRIFNHQLNLIENVFPELNKKERKLIAQRYWAYGRGVLREGFPEEASQYFERALSIGKRSAILGNPVYKVLTQLTNPYIGEKFMSITRSVIFFNGK